MERHDRTIFDLPSIPPFLGVLTKTPGESGHHRLPLQFRHGHIHAQRPQAPTFLHVLVVLLCTSKPCHKAGVNNRFLQQENLRLASPRVRFFGEAAIPLGREHVPDLFGVSRLAFYQFLGHRVRVHLHVAHQHSLH